MSVFGYTDEELIEVDPMLLRTLIHEQTQVFIYRIMAGKMEVPANFEIVESLLDIWRRRGCRRLTTILGATRALRSFKLESHT